MGMEKQRTGQIGVNVVERVILRDWLGRWQPIDSVNDDGIDGLIFLESRGVPTGQIIFVQIKCTKSKPNGSGFIAIPISREKLLMNVDRWRRVVGAAILVHVDPDTLAATWVNLRAPKALGNTQVFVPATNTFDKSSRKPIAGLCGTIHRDLLMKRVITRSSDFPYLVDPKHIQTAARTFYREMEISKMRLGKSGPQIRFTKEGWNHITRPGRARLIQLQSFQLLGAIRRIIESSSDVDLKEITPQKGATAQFVYLIAAVSFPFRQTAIVKIVLWRRIHPVEGVNYSFHTVYEPRRRRDVMGVMEA
jgi:hypothetical protein